MRVKTKYKKIKKRDHSSLFFSVILGILLFAVVGFLVASNLKINQRRTELNSELKTLRAEYETLLEKKRQLETQISQAGNPDYLEREARERFNLRKPGEEVVAVIPSEESEGPFKDQEIEK